MSETEHVIENDNAHTGNRSEERIGKLRVRIDEVERHSLKRVLQAAVDQITLDPANLYCRIATDRTLDMASPRGFEPLLPA